MRKRKSLKEKKANLRTGEHEIIGFFASNSNLQFLLHIHIVLCMYVHIYSQKRLT